MARGEDRSFFEVQIGEELPVLEKRITQEVIDLYAKASEDPNPLHTDPEFAKTTPFQGTIAHGTMYLAYISEMIMQWFPTQWICGGQMEVSFLAPARPGDVVSVKGKVVDKVAGASGGEVVLDVVCEIQGGKAIVAGKARCPVR